MPGLWAGQNLDAAGSGQAGATSGSSAFRSVDRLASVQARTPASSLVRTSRERTPRAGCPVPAGPPRRRAASRAPISQVRSALPLPAMVTSDPERELPDEVPDEVSVQRLQARGGSSCSVVHRHDDLQLHCARSMRRGLIATRISRRVRGAVMAPVPGGRAAVTRCRAAAFARRHAARWMRRWVRRRRPPPDRLSRLNDRDARVVSRRTCGHHLLAFHGPFDGLPHWN